MKIGNKEYGFRLTTGASVEIAKLCPNEDLLKIGDAIGNGYGRQAEAMARMIVALNEGFVAFEKFEGREANRLTYEHLMSMSPAQFAEVSRNAIKAFTGDIDGEIEVESEKKAAAEG